MTIRGAPTPADRGGAARSPQGLQHRIIAAVADKDTFFETGKRWGAR